MQVKHYFQKIVKVKLERTVKLERNEEGKLIGKTPSSLTLDVLHKAIADQISSIYSNVPEKTRVKTYVNHQGLNKLIDATNSRQWSVGDVVLTSTNREERINIVFDVECQVIDEQGPCMEGEDD